MISKQIVRTSPFVSRVLAGKIFPCTFGKGSHFDILFSYILRASVGIYCIVGGFILEISIITTFLLAFLLEEFTFWLIRMKCSFFQK